MFEKVFGVGKLDRPAFARLVARTGVEVGRFRSPVVDEENFAIEDGDGGVMFLHNTHVEFSRMSRRERMPFLREWLVRSTPETVPESWDEIRPLLRPTIRDAGYLTFAGLQSKLAGHDASSIAARPYAPGLFEGLVVDMPTQMLGVNEDQLTRWNVSIDEAAEIARNNLRRELEDKFSSIGPGVWCATGSEYEASRLLLPDMLQRVCTNPLVVVPNRGVMFVADPSMSHTFDGLVAILADLEEKGNPHPISHRIYQLDDKTLRPFEPPADAARRTAYELLLVQQDMGLYKHEQGLRTQLDPDVFYASLMAVQNDKGRIIRLTTWTMGIESCLPPADLINFVELDESGSNALRTWTVPWAKVVAKRLLEPTSSPLPRWQTRNEPSRDWLDTNVDDSILGPPKADS
jgi:hypothetical protein